jgi:signal transduction histidine kinase
MNARVLQPERFAIDSSTLGLLDRVEALLPALEGGGADAKTIVAQARRRAEAVLRAAGAGDQSGALPVFNFVAECIGRLALKGEVSEQRVREVLEILATESDLEDGLVEAEVYLRAIRDPAMSAAPVPVALQAQLRLLCLLTPVTGASLWTMSADAVLEIRGEAGNCATLGLKSQARRVLSGSPARHLEADSWAVPVLRAGRPCAALAVRTPGGGRATAFPLVREATAAIAPLLERESLLERSSERERWLVESSERRLVRLGFDLHDGAMQDIAALASDVRFFRSQLQETILDPEHEALLLGRVDDLTARLSAVDRGLRTLVRSFETPTIAKRPLPQVLRDDVGLFCARTEIPVALEATGDFSELTASQRIALLRVVQEALSNAGEHSGAGTIRVSVVRQDGHTTAEIADDGCGFDVERTLADAAQSGRLGLLGMSERIRLLGGMFDVESRPGGPTVVHAALPDWQPPSTDGVERRLEAREEQAPSSG